MIRAKTGKGRKSYEKVYKVLRPFAGIADAGRGDRNSDSFAEKKVRKIGEKNNSCRIRVVSVDGACRL